MLYRNTLGSFGVTGTCTCGTGASSRKASFPQAERGHLLSCQRSKSFSFVSEYIVLENQSWLHHNSIPFSQFLSDKTCTMLLDTVIFIRQSRGQICWMVSKFQWGLSQRAPCTDRSGVTDKARIVESLKSPASSQHWWATSRSLGHNLLESFSYVENLGSFHSEVSGQEAPLWGAQFHAPRSGAVFHLHAPAWAWRGTAWSSALMQQAGRGLLSSLDASSLPGREALPGSACQLSVLRSAGRKVFPTASADRTSTELSKGDLAEMPTSQLQWRNWLRLPLSPQTPASRAAADTQSLFLCLRPDAAETSLHPGALTCQRISASRPQARGDGFGIAKPQLFQQRQAMTSPSTQSRNGSRGEADTCRVGSTSTSLSQYQGLDQGSAALAPPQSTQTEGLGWHPGSFTPPEDAPRRHRWCSNNTHCWGTMVRQGGVERKHRVCQLRGTHPAWRLEKLSCLWVLHAKPTAQWAEWELSFCSVLVLVAEQEGIASRSGLLSTIGNRKKNQFRLCMQTDLMTFRIGILAND